MCILIQSIYIATFKNNFLKKRYPNVFQVFIGKKKIETYCLHCERGERFTKVLKKTNRRVLLKNIKQSKKSMFMSLCDV